jgi:hypothetical protein
MIKEAQVSEEKHLQEIKIDNARWDAILTTEKGQILLEKLANEALAEHRAGATESMDSESDSGLSR